MSVCRLVKTWLPNEHSALKPAECLVPLRRRGPGHTGPLFLLPTERPECKTQPYRQTGMESHKHFFYVTLSWNVNKRQDRLPAFRVLISSALFWKNRVGEGDFISSAADYCRFVIPAPGRSKPQCCSSGEQEDTTVPCRLAETSRPRHDFTLHYELVQ